MTKEKLNWLSFTGDERINRQWNRPATSTMYILDHTGTIRTSGSARQSTLRRKSFP